MPLYFPSASQNVSNVRVLYSTTLSASNSFNDQLLEETLASYPLSAGYLASSGSGIRITAWGTFADNNNPPKKVYLKFGSTDLTDGGVGYADAFGGWFVNATVFRIHGNLQTSAVNMSDGTSYFTVATAPSESLSSIVPVSCSCIGLQPADIVLRGFLIESLI